MPGFEPRFLRGTIFYQGGIFPMFRITNLLFAGAIVALGFSTLTTHAQDKDKKTENKPNPAIKAVPRDGGWMKRHEKYLEQTQKNKYDVVFLGDSITDAWPGGGKDAWTTTLKPFNPGGYGIGGDRTQHLLWRITEGKELDGLSPKAAVVMIGTNNAGSDTAEQIAEGIKAVVMALREKQPKTKILLLAVFPRAGAPKEAKVATKDQLNKKIPQINAIISKLDDGKMIFYKDIGPKFLTEDGGLSREVMPDLLHLSKKGYQIWADSIKEDLEKLTK